MKKDTAIGLQATQSMEEAGRKVFVYHFNDLLKQDSGTRLGEDIEALHNMRVATRRMRAAVRIFENGFTPSALKFLKIGLKETAQFLGSVRDLDVFIEKVTVYQQELTIDKQTGLTPLLNHCYRQRNLARTKMLSYLDSKKYKKFKEKTARFVKKNNTKNVAISFDKPTPFQIRHVAPLLLYNRYETLCAYEPFLNNASVEQLHQLRIDFKHFRYALENFQEILGDESLLILSEIKQIQDCLGNLNDARVGCELVKNFLNNWKKYRKSLNMNKAKKPVAVIDYLKIKTTECEQLLTTFPNVWHEFNSTKLRNHLALAVANL